MIFQSFDLFLVCRPLKWHSATICNVTTVQLPIIGTVHNFQKNLLFIKYIHLPSTFILRYVRAKMIVHAFLIEHDEKYYCYPRKIQNFENLCTKFIGELLSCDTTYSGRVTSREGDIQNFA